MDKQDILKRIVQNLIQEEIEVIVEKEKDKLQENNNFKLK